MSIHCPSSPIYGSTLKWLAILTMLCDHIAALVLMPAYGISFYWSLDELITALAGGGITALCVVLRLIGRIAFPIFCFLLVEGLFYTRSRLRYLRNLIVAALLSEIPFDLCLRAVPFSLSVQNVMWTLALGLLACTAIDALLKQGLDDNLRILASLGAVAVCMAVARYFMTDYDAFGVILIVLLHVLRQSRAAQCLVGAVATAFECTAPLAFLFIYFYNGQRGRQMKWFFYLFYPVHLLALYLIRRAWIGW